MQKKSVKSMQGSKISSNSNNNIENYENLKKELSSKDKIVKKESMDNYLDVPKEEFDSKLNLNVEIDVNKSEGIDTKFDV